MHFVARVHFRRFGKPGLIASEAFHTTDDILQLVLSVSANLVVFPTVITKQLGKEVQFTTTETILLVAAIVGVDFQRLHRTLRTSLLAAGMQSKKEGLSKNLSHQVFNAKRHK